MNLVVCGERRKRRKRRRRELRKSGALPYRVLQNTSGARVFALNEMGHDRQIRSMM